MKKIIVRITHDRHLEDVLRVYKYSEENLNKVKQDMEKQWEGGTWDYFSDLPSENGKQFGWNDSYHDSYSIVEVQE